METWERMDHWYLVLPPSRPSPYHLSVLRDEMSKIDRGKPVAVLGSTPEFRDLLFQLGFRDIFVFEKHASVYSALSELRCHTNSETLVIGNWVETLPTYPGKFEVILSDLTSGNIPYDLQGKFYSGIARALNEEGVFIDKILTFHGPKRNIKVLSARYSEMPFNLLTLNYFNCEFLFCSELLDVKDLVDTTMFYEILEGEFTNDVLRKFLSECRKITPPDSIWYYGREWDEVSVCYDQSLEKLKEYAEEAGSPYYGNLKIIISGRKHKTEA